MEPEVEPTIGSGQRRHDRVALAACCWRAWDGGPNEFSLRYVDDDGRWAVAEASAAAVDSAGELNRTPLMELPVKLAVLAAAQLRAAAVLMESSGPSDWLTWTCSWRWRT